MNASFLDHIRTTLSEIDAAGLTKRERQIVGPQGGRIMVAGPSGPREMVNLCANNYLGLANHPEIVQAALESVHKYGFGMASVRFICGTLDLHRELEQATAAYLG